MSRKDYELIAACIHRSRMAKGLIKNSKDRAAALSGIALVASDLQASLQHDNLRFDADRFAAACGF